MGITEKLCELADKRWLKIVILIICLTVWSINFVLIAKDSDEDNKKQNNQMNAFIIVFIIFYLYFIICIKIKSACGLHTSFYRDIEILESILRT